MLIISTISEMVFQINGINYLKNYISRPYGNKIEIFNCFERADILIPQTGYQDFTVNGATFTNVADLQAALLNVLFNRNSLSGLSFPDATAATKGKLQLAGDLSGNASAPTVPALASKLNIEVPAATGSVVSFTQDRIYGTLATPVIGNITANLTGAKFGVTNMMIHNSAIVPTFESRFKKYLGSQDYIPSVNNYIYMVYLDADHINYLIQQTI
jgi:hypothetical protein